MKTLFWIVPSMLVLASCAPSVPDSGAVVTLEPMSAEARNARNAELQGTQSTTTVQTGATTATATTSSGLSNDASFTGGAVVATSLPTATSGTYEVVAPEPVPSRPADTGPSVVAYALETNHAVGQQVYARSAPSAETSARACDRYASADLAQAAFLAAGGPEKDGRSLDPDGDGYACSWDPVPFRKAIQ